MSLFLRPMFFWALCLAACSVVLAPATAHAGLQLCNRTSYVLYAAVGSQAGPSIQTQGWTRVAPGSCETAVPQSLNGGAYYVIARTSQAHSGPTRVWSGQTMLCAKNTDFSLKTQIGAPNCPSDDAFPMPFALLDTHAMRNWTMTFTEGPALATMDAARAAGLKRLLRDNGFKIAAIDASPDKASDAALAQFKKRMKLADNAGPDDLYDALETEALKIAAPAGYSVCNDTDEPIWAAIALKNGKDWVSRGWWEVAAGSCARAIANPLSNDDIYLLAERHGGEKIVSGNMTFCVADVQFETTGREKCSTRGLTEVGFADTRTKGLAGYSAHVGDDGLIAPLSIRR